MTVIALDRRIISRAPERFLISLGLVATAAGACSVFPELLARPWLLAGAEIVIFALSLVIYGLLKSRSKTRKLEKAPPQHPVPGLAHLAELASHDTRMEILFRAHEARFSGDSSQIESHRKLLEQEWLALRSKFAHELCKTRLSFAEELREKYLVFVESSAFSGTLFEEVVEEFGVSVRRIPHEYLAPSNTPPPDANSEYVILVMPGSLRFGPEHRVVYDFRELATQREVAHRLSSELLDYPRAWLSSEFVMLVGELFSRIAQTALIARAILPTTSAGPANHEA